MSQTDHANMPHDSFDERRRGQEVLISRGLDVALHSLRKDQKAISIFTKSENTSKAKEEFSGKL